MNIYVDADIIAAWERGDLDLPRWIEENHPEDTLVFPPTTVWQQLLFGKFAWGGTRAAKRARYLEAIRGGILRSIS